jgi:hypothetical protein
MGFEMRSELKDLAKAKGLTAASCARAGPLPGELRVWQGSCSKVQPLLGPALHNVLPVETLVIQVHLAHCTLSNFTDIAVLSAAHGALDLI